MTTSEKTISYLNQKIWYRAIKVLYILGFIYVATFVTLFAYQTNYKKIEVDNALTRITCNYGNKSVFSAEDAGIVFNLSEFSAGTNLSDEHRIALMGACDIGLDDRIEKYSLPFSGINEINDYFSVVSLFKYGLDLNKFILTLGTGLVWLWLSFEIMRRIFYYIVCGKLMPHL